MLRGEPRRREHLFELLLTSVIADGPNFSIICRLIRFFHNRCWRRKDTFSFDITAGASKIGSAFFVFLTFLVMPQICLQFHRFPFLVSIQPSSFRDLLPTMIVHVRSSSKNSSVSTSHETKSVDPNDTANDDWNSRDSRSPTGTYDCQDDDFPPQKKKKNKSVRFHSTVTVRPILSFKDYTKEERLACWYQTDEFRAIQNKNVVLIRVSTQTSLASRTSLNDKVASSSMPSPQHRYCLRGLEAFLDPAQQKIFARLALFEAVMQLQDEEYFMADTIATACQQLSQSSKERALWWGEHDCHEAKRCLATSWKKKPVVKRTS
jgi:hypothetical protein